MTMKHRPLCLLLAVCMLLALTAGGCGSRNEAEPSAPQPDVSVESAAAAARETAAPEEPLPGDKPFLFRIDQLADDGQACTIRIHCENLTKDKPMIFLLSGFSVNGYVRDPLWNEYLEPLGKSDSKVVLDRSELEKDGITSVDEVHFVLRVLDDSGETMDQLTTTSYTLYPSGVAPDKVVYPERRKGAAEKVMADDDRVSFVVLEVNADETDGFALNCYLENKTNDYLTFGIENVSVDGQPIEQLDPMFSFWEIPAGKRCYAQFLLWDFQLEDLGVTAPKTIEFTLIVEKRVGMELQPYATYEHFVYHP